MLAALKSGIKSGRSHKSIFYYLELLLVISPVVWARDKAEWDGGEVKKEVPSCSPGAGWIRLWNVTCLICFQTLTSACWVSPVAL